MNEQNQMSTHNRVVKHHSSSVDFGACPSASFTLRAVAIFIDAIIVGMVGEIIIRVITIAIPMSPAALIGVAMLLNFAIPIFYFIYFLKKDGQTVGKKIMGIKVINSDNTAQLTVGTIIQREFWGKFISSIIFMLGYIVFLFGKETWHDRIADTKVVSIK